MGKRFLAAGLACLVTLAAWTAVSMPAAQDIVFTAVRAGDPLGRHRVEIRTDGDVTRVKTEIDFHVSLAFLTVYRLRHTSREVWRDGLLVSLDSQTNDNGQEHAVQARATRRGLVVEGPAGRSVVPAETMTTGSYWHPGVIAAERLIDTRTGRILEVTARRVATERIRAGGRTVEADRYRIDGDIKLNLWYAGQDWVKLSFRARGSDVDYVREP
ncbi:DUF6134 family protein [Arenibaculum sp.]|jgi:hypothetical protein|uniref:DUF6134 family protein n=1 Tax=Arenibaculum sp. TaxID=2865862 RepID=UPI002E0F2F1D|nr:DUF6134 family protein [Arenibaculum sp.]